MKFSIFALLFIASTTVHAAYDPFTVKCTYSAGHDGLLTLESKADPGEDDFTYTIYSHAQKITEHYDFKSILVYTPDEVPQLQARIKKLARIANIDLSKVFTISEFTIDDGSKDVTMILYKFNSHTSSLGFSIYTEVPNYQGVTVCK